MMCEDVRSQAVGMQESREPKLCPAPKATVGPSSDLQLFSPAFFCTQSGSYTYFEASKTT